MVTSYRLNANELDERFIESLKAAFKNKEIEIIVTEVDETEYLLRSDANADHIKKAIDDFENNRNIIVPDKNKF